MSCGLIIMQTHGVKSVITETEPDMTSQPTACDNTLQSIAEEACPSAEIQSTSTPAATNDEAQGSSKAFINLDDLDGPTIIAEVCPFFTRVYHAHWAAAAVQAA